MSKPKVLVTRKWPAEVEAELKEKYDVTLNDNDVALTIPELQEAFQNYDPKIRGDWIFQLLLVPKCFQIGKIEGSFALLTDSISNTISDRDIC